MNNIHFDQTTYSKLTDRELQIAQASVEGLTVIETAERFGIQPNTVSSFRQRIMDKLGCRTFIEAIYELTKGGIL